jgi:hypothetical protein
MPRPSTGYRNAAGDKIPGTHDVTKRFEDNAGLNTWRVGEAYKRGVEDGKNGTTTKEDRSAIAIGTAVHLMCEIALRGASEHEIDAIPGRELTGLDHVIQAKNSYDQFKAWKATHKIEIISQEESIVSEAMQFGGTPDVVARVDGVIALVDFKSCQTKNRGTLYLSQRIAMAAHAFLWNEKHPDQKIEAFYLVNLPKDGGTFAEFALVDLSREWAMFTLQLQLYGLEKGKPMSEPVTVVDHHPIPLQDKGKVENQADLVTTIALEPVKAAPDFAAEIAAARAVNSAILDRLTVPFVLVEPPKAVPAPSVKPKRAACKKKPIAPPEPQRSPANVPMPQQLELAGILPPKQVQISIFDLIERVA